MIRILSALRLWVLAALLAATPAMAFSVHSGAVNSNGENFSDPDNTADNMADQLRGGQGNNGTAAPSSAATMRGQGFMPTAPVGPPQR
jgi:hypothetical protein